MDKPKLTILLVIALSAAAVRANAQVVEFSAGVGGTKLADWSDFWGTSLRSAALDGRVSLWLTDRFAIEPFVTYGRRSIPVSAYATNAIGGDTQRTEGLYGVVVRQRLLWASRSGFDAFVDYGLTGFYTREAIPERQFVYGRAVFTQPGSTSSRTEPMIFPVVGFGVRKSLGDHLALRADADMLTFFALPVGVRASVGLAVPLGRAR